jgi:hypothetical protein
MKKHTISNSNNFNKKNPNRQNRDKLPERAAILGGKRRLRWLVIAASVAATVLAVVVTMAHWGGDKSSPESSTSSDLSVPPKVTKVTPEVENKSYTTAIQLSLNPDVEIRLGEDGVVIEVVGLNEDGVVLIEGIDFAGMSLENATIMVVNRLILQGYITAAEIQEEINISLSSETMTLDTLTVITSIIETAAAEQNIAVDVIQNVDANSLQIVLTGEGEPDVWPELPPEAEVEPNDEDAEIGLEMEFIMAGGTNSAYVDNVLIHTSEGETIENLMDFAGTRLNQAALRSITSLLDKEYITSSDASKIVRFYFTGNCADGDIEGVANLTELLLAEYDMKIAVTTDTKGKEILLIPDKTVTHEVQTSKYDMLEVMNTMVNKDEADLSPRQLAILKSAFNFREYQRLLEKRYFVIIPDLVGMTEEQAVEILLELGLKPSVVREKVTGYDPVMENGGLPTRPPYVEGEEQLEPQGPTWDFPVVGFGCVFYTDAIAGSPCQSGFSIQINVIVPKNDEQPEITDYRDDNGIVISEMDVPFDVAGYPDTFSLSDAEGFSEMIDEMNERYTIDNEADYTVIIDRDTGWEGTALITIAHKDGFPMSKFFIQDGRIIEHEFLWRRDAPTAQDIG